MSNTINDTILALDGTKDQGIPASDYAGELILKFKSEDDFREKVLSEIKKLGDQELYVFAKNY